MKKVISRPSAYSSGREVQEHKLDIAEQGYKPRVLQMELSEDEQGQLSDALFQYISINAWPEDKVEQQSDLGLAFVDRLIAALPRVRSTYCG